MNRNSLKSRLQYYVLFLFALVLAGCANTSNYNSVSKLESESNQRPKIAVMPIDVELSLLGATGIEEVQAEWTQNAKILLEEEIAVYMQELDANTEPYIYEAQDANSVELQLAKLHEVVGYSIMVHEIGLAPLPSRPKFGKWTLGEDAKKLKERSGADYALFMFVRDSYSSSGRIAMQAVGAIFGVGITGGTQVGFSSLVDLETGDIVWFNQLVSTTGDIRERKGTKKAIKGLLDSIPSA